jgi:hypothetical protein
MGRTNIVTELLGHAEVVRYIDIGNDLGRSALHEAAGRANVQMVQALLDSGADIDVLDNKGMTPLHLVIWLRRYESSKEEDEAGGEEGCRLLENARLKMAETLLSRDGARVNTKDQFGKRLSWTGRPEIQTPIAHESC